MAYFVNPLGYGISNTDILPDEYQVNVTNLIVFWAYQGLHKYESGSIVLELN